MLWDYVYNTLNSFSCREEKVSSIVWTHIRYGILHNFKPLGQNEFIVCKTDSIFFSFTQDVSTVKLAHFAREIYSSAWQLKKKRFWGEQKVA